MVHGMGDGDIGFVDMLKKIITMLDVFEITWYSERHLDYFSDD